MKLYLVRHGASTGNTPGNLLGHSDHPLTKAGASQARAVAARLAPLGPMPVYCSDLVRARETAQHIARMWAGTSSEGRAGSSAVPVNDSRLRELSLGSYEGRSWDEYLADEDLNAAMIVDPLHTRMPGGESVAQMQERVLAAVHEIVVRHGGKEAAQQGDCGASVPLGALQCSEASAAACVVAHDGPIRAILNHFLGVRVDRWWALTTTHGGLSLLEWSHGWVNVRFVNEIGHLEAFPTRSVRRTGRYK